MQEFVEARPSDAKRVAQLPVADSGIERRQQSGGVPLARLLTLALVSLSGLLGASE
jgi:hypothetical protein